MFRLAAKQPRNRHSFYACGEKNKNIARTHKFRLFRGNVCGASKPPWRGKPHQAVHLVVLLVVRYELRPILKKCVSPRYLRPWSPVDLGYNLLGYMPVIYTTRRAGRN